MRFPRTLSALAIVAILAPIPAAAASLTPDPQQRPVRPLRMVVRRAIMLERRLAVQQHRQRLGTSPQLQGQDRARSMRLRAQLRQTLRTIRMRIARNRGIRKF